MQVAPQGSSAPVCVPTTRSESTPPSRLQLVILRVNCAWFNKVAPSSICWVFFVTKWIASIWSFTPRLKSPTGGGVKTRALDWIRIKIFLSPGSFCQPGNYLAHASPVGHLRSARDAKIISTTMRLCKTYRLSWTSNRGETEGFPGLPSRRVEAQ